MLRRQLLKLLLVPVIGQTVAAVSQLWERRKSGSWDWSISLTCAASGPFRVTIVELVEPWRVRHSALIFPPIHGKMRWLLPMYFEKPIKFAIRIDSVCGRPLQLYSVYYLSGIAPPCTACTS